MKIDDPEFFKQLLSTFRVEAKERTQKISLVLLELEQNTELKNQKTLVESLYRELHSLKSGARAVNILSAERICQELENVFSEFKEKEAKPTEQQFNFLYKLNTHIDQLTQALEEKPELMDSANELLILLKKTLTNDSPNDSPHDVQDHMIKNSLHNTVEKQQAKSKDETQDSSNKVNNQSLPSVYEPQSKQIEATIRISAKKLDSLLVQAEEMLAAKLNFTNRTQELLELKTDIFGIKKAWNKIIADTFSLKKTSKDSFFTKSISNSSPEKMLDYMTGLETSIKNLILTVENISNRFDQNMHSFSLGVDNLLEDSKKMMLLPFSTVLNSLPVTVRELSHSLHKKINFTLTGTDLEIDKRILEEMKDVLLHLIRNAIDHGIEEEAERSALNKPEVGNISIDIRHLTGNEIQIEFKDDGSGVNLTNIKQSALKQGMISLDETKHMSDNDALALIYQSGVSSSPNITDLSGRGLGMTIIREKIEKVGGNIVLSSFKNVGTIIKITLPLTLATFKGLVVRVSNQTFIVPTSNLEKIMSIFLSTIKTVENQETILDAGQVISLYWLADILSLPREVQKRSEHQKYVALILASTEYRAAFIVDEILNESEILIKQFSYPILRIRYIAAAAILGTGKPIPILNTIDLLQTHQFGNSNNQTKINKKDFIEKNRSVLLAEDSITTRMLIKNILESDGYNVTTAIDGLDAWEKLKVNQFELLVSDIEMPRMTGFELTEKIRKDKKLLHIPIVLVTSRETQEDKERGIDLGANAYVLKSSFDSKHLLDIIKKLSL